MNTFFYHFFVVITFFHLLVVRQGGFYQIPQAAKHSAWLFVFHFFTIYNISTVRNTLFWGQNTMIELYKRWAYRYDMIRVLDDTPHLYNEYL